MPISQPQSERWTTSPQRPLGRHAATRPTRSSSWQRRTLPSRKAKLAAKTADKGARATRRTRTTPTRRRKKAKKPAKPAEPSRIWVQVAGGANDDALPKEFKRLQQKAPKLLAKRGGWTTPLHATNRLLVGPFKSDDDAQDFINELRKAGLHGFAWTSDEGQKIAKLKSD